MINDYILSALKEMVNTLDDLTTQFECIVAALKEPDVCAKCRYFREHTDGGRGRPWWQCLTRNPIALHGFNIAQAQEICCIYFERRKPKEDGD